MAGHACVLGGAIARPFMHSAGSEAHFDPARSAVSPHVG